MLLRDNDIADMLKEKLDVQEVEVIDLKGGNHWQVNITASEEERMTSENCCILQIVEIDILM